MFYKKTVVMVSAGGGNEKAVLDATYQDGITFGSIKMYNVKDLTGINVLAFLTNNKVIKCPLNEKNKFEYNFRTEQDVDLVNSFCAFINVFNAKAKPIVVGNCSKPAKDKKEEMLACCMSKINQNDKLNVETVKKELDNFGIDFDDEEKENIDQIIDEEIDKCDCSNNNCSGCKYREAFYKDGDKDDANSDATYYSEVSEQLQQLFETCEREKQLEDVVPNSKWVKVDYEGNGNYYVVGLIYENEQLKFVCFGVPGFYASESPKELEGICKWVPVDDSKPFEYGYWITYQNAQTGENVNVEIV